MLETEDRAASPGRPPSDGTFSGLRPGERLLIHPAIPRTVEHPEYRVQDVEADRVVLRERVAGIPLSIAAAAVAQFHAPHGERPAMLVLKGRLQWITATRQWTVLPEGPPADSEHGLHKLTNASDPRVMEFIEQLRQQGHSPWWVPLESMGEFLAQGGEIIYDLDGRYLRTRDRRSEWILLGRNPAAAAASLP